MIINTLSDLAKDIGCDRDAISKALFKGTSCGVSFMTTEKGISIAGYAEGAGDAECMPHELNYPFESKDFWKALETADIEGCELWDEYNLDEDYNIED